MRPYLIHGRAEGMAVVVAHAVLGHSIDLASADAWRQRELIGVTVLVLAALVVGRPLQNDPPAAQH